MFRSLCASFRSGRLAFLLTFLLLIPFVFVFSPAHAASSNASAAFQRRPHAETPVAPKRTSTMTAPRHVSGSPSRQPNSLTSVLGSQPALSSGAKALNSPVQPNSALRPNTMTATPSFAGQQGSLYGQQDPSADVGRYNVMEVAHESMSIYDRSGNFQYSDDLNAWFGTSGIWMGDVFYDPWNEQFVFVATDNYTSIYIAVAQQMNALGSYCNYTFSLANYGSIPLDKIVTDQAVGFDETYLYYTANEYTEGTREYSFIYQINLKQMETCSSTSSWTWDHMTDPSGQPAFSLVPAMKYSYNVANDEEYLVEANLNGACSIVLWRINNHVLYNSTINTECYSPPPYAPQLGGVTIPTPPPGVVFHQATYINGLLDFALATNYDWGGGDVTSAIAWIKISPESAVLSQQGYIGSPSYWYFNPAMAQDLNGKSVMVFDVSNSSMYTAVWYVAQNADGSEQNTISLVSSTASVPTLGDYQSARLDPVDEVHIWICGSFGQGAPGWESQIAETAAS